MVITPLVLCPPPKRRDYRATIAVGKGGMVQGKCRSEKRWASDPSDEGQKKAATQAGLRTLAVSVRENKMRINRNRSSCQSM